MASPETTPQPPGIIKTIPLPPGIIDKEEFYAWKICLIDQLKQNTDYMLFLPGGLYSEWLPLKDAMNEQRIPVLHPNDPDRLNYAAKLETPEHLDTVSNGIGDGNVFLETEWLSRRNTQLEEFIVCLSKLSNKANINIIKNYGSNFEFIMNFILDSHNYEKKHQNILELSEINPDKNQEYNAYYTKFRGAISNNLKKIGAKIKFMGDFELIEDEILSPTFEEVILLWSLEKIDPRLPFLVNQTFGYRLVDNLTLKDIQDEIFEKIPQLLEESLELQNNVINHENYFGSSRKKMKVEENIQPKVNGEDCTIKEETIAEIENDLVEHIDDLSQFLSLEEDGDEDFKPKVRATRRHKKVARVEKDIDRDDKDWNLEDTSEQRDCEFCSGSYKSKKILLEHVRGIHKVKYACKHCDITLNNHKTYEKHLKELHILEFPTSYEEAMKLHKHVCRHCHHPSNDLHTLRQHILTHRDNGDIVYTDGPSEPRKKRADRVRYDDMEDDKDDVFNDLENEDNDSSFLPNKKSENPESDRPYKCNECGRGFTSEARLTTHLADHRKGPIICEFCDRKLKNNRVLSEHIRIRHKLNFKCKTCNCYLKNQRIYEEHIKASHPEQFIGQHGLKVRSHSHVCRYCLQPQVSHQQLKLHTFRHKELGELNFIMKNSTEHVFNFDDDDGADMEPLPDTKPVNTAPLAPQDQKALDEARRLKSQKSKEKEMCDICGVYFVNVEQHRRIHSIEGLTCLECDIGFEDRRAFLRHNKKHRDTEKKASCDQCGKGFTNIYHLNKHLKKHIKVQKIGGEKLKCDTCNRTFFDKKEMGSHVCKHHSCEICGIKFLRARNLRLHARMHSGEVVYPCELCESLFLNKKRRREHFRDYHTNNEKKYKCDICDKRFLVKTGLTNHVYTHTGEKPFKCDECGLRFTQKGNLDTHMKLHSTEMPYSCHVCHAKFKQSGEIKRHREVYKCGFSQDDFYTVQDQ